MAALDQVEANRNVRCLIITATGPTFSAGYDIGKLALGGDNDEMFGLCDRVENLVQPGAIDVESIVTPGIFVHRMVHVPNVEKRIEQRTVRERTVRQKEDA